MLGAQDTGTRERRGRICPRLSAKHAWLLRLLPDALASGTPRPNPQNNKMPEFKHVNDLWNDEEAAQLDPVDRLIYRSNLLGADGRITNTGGGNTSAKLPATDPISGESVEVLWVKGSGGDLRTAKRENFSSLYQSKLISLQKLVCARARARRQNRRRRQNGWIICANHVRSQPARQFD